MEPSGEICVAVDLIEDTVAESLCCEEDVQDVHDVLHFMKYDPLQNQLQGLQNGPQNKVSLLYQFHEFL